VTVAAGVATMMTLSPQMEGDVAAKILPAFVSATSVLLGHSKSAEVDFTDAR
jgi:hypothetical protein